MSINFKKILLPIFIITYLWNADAQYKFGIQGGVGSSNYHGNDFSTDNQPKTGITAGLFYEREINRTISLGGEINYEQKGTSYNYSPRVATNISSDSHLEYLSVPLLAKAYLDYNAYFFCYTGISAAYLLNSSNLVKVTEYGYIIDTKSFFDYDFRKFDAALLIGIGLDIKEIILNIRYSYGIIDVYKGSNVPDIKNQFISVTLGFTIYKKKSMSCLNPWNRVK